MDDCSIYQKRITEALKQNILVAPWEATLLVQAAMYGECDGKKISAINCLRPYFGFVG